MSATWDAAAYDRASDPLVLLALPVIERLGLSAAETVLDAGCGSGRVTELLLGRAAQVVAVDADPAMVEHARERLGDRATVHQQDIRELDVAPVDAILSTATLHWIADHESVFRRFAACLRPGGRLSIQCGGHGNLDAVLAEAEVTSGPWYFATPEETAERLRAAGFSDVQAWLVEAEVSPEDPAGYLETIVFHGFPDAAERARRVRRDSFDYVRLNATAVRP